MKIIIDRNVRKPTPQERAAAIERAHDWQDDPDGFRRDMLAKKEVVIPGYMVDELKAIGMTPDDLVAMVLKAAKASQ